MAGSNEYEIGWDKYCRKKEKEEREQTKLFDEN